MRDPRSEPETTPEPTAEPESNYAPNAEPIPEWPAAKHVWQWAWELHWIGFGIAFLLLVIWSAMALLRARKTPLLVTRRFCYAVNFLLIVFGTTRALALFLYPYEMVENASGTPIVLERLLFGIGFPCLAAGFTLIHYAFLEAAKVSFSSRKIQSLRFIIGVIVVHFTLVVIAEVVTSYVPNTSALVITCMLYFIICTLVVAASVFYSGIKVMRQSKTHRQTLKRISVRASASNDATLTGGKVKFSNKESNTRKVARVTMATAGLGIACAVIQVYAMVGVFNVRARGPVVPKPWPWWSYQTLFRLFELGLAATMAYTVSQPKKGHDKLRNFPCCMSMSFVRPRAETYTDSGHTLSENIVVKSVRGHGDHDSATYV